MAQGHAHGDRARIEKLEQELSSLQNEKTQQKVHAKRMETLQSSLEEAQKNLSKKDGQMKEMQMKYESQQLLDKQKYDQMVLMYDAKLLSSQEEAASKLKISQQQSSSKVLAVKEEAAREIAKSKSEAREKYRKRLQHIISQHKGYRNKISHVSGLWNKALADKQAALEGALKQVEIEKDLKNQALQELGLFKDSPESEPVVIMAVHLKHVSCYFHQTQDLPAAEPEVSSASAQPKARPSSPVATPLRCPDNKHRAGMTHHAADLAD